MRNGYSSEKRGLKTVLQGRKPPCLLSLSGVTVLDSTGVGALAQVFKDTNEPSWRVVVSVRVQGQFVHVSSFLNRKD